MLEGIKEYFSGTSFTAYLLGAGAGHLAISVGKTIYDLTTSIPYLIQTGDLSILTYKIPETLELASKAAIISGIGSGFIATKIKKKIFGFLRRWNNGRE